jgi:starch-binding outer membrane protein, SusD/RagB family
MRRQLTAFLGVAVLAGLPACADLTEEMITEVGPDYYATPEGLDAAVNGAYAQLRDYWGREQAMNLSAMGTDLWTHGDQGGNKGLNRYDAQINSEYDQFRWPWESFYRGINTANTVIGRAGNVQGVSPAIRNSRLGEARFLRALQYFELVRMYGDVPLLLTENQGVAVEFTRAPAADVYAAIVEDLTTAIELLPVTQPQFGRATRGAAQHLLAKVYLTRAYRSFAQQGDFQRAADLAIAVINSGTYQLLPSFREVFCGPPVVRAGAPQPRDRCSLTGFTENHSEVIFSVVFPRDPALRVADRGNGMHLWYLGWYDDLPGLPRTVEYGRAWRRVRPTAFALDLWDRAVDSRFDATFQTVWYATAAASQGAAGTSRGPLAVGDTAYWMPSTPEETALVNSAFRQSRPYVIRLPNQYTEERFPSMKKHQDDARESAFEPEGSRDLIVMRLGETYLIAAEALLGAGRTGDAVQYLNAVRRRAAKPGVNPSVMEINASQVTLDFILDERGRELIGELHEWFDLTRTNKLVERVRLHNPQGAAGVQAHHALRPIPQREIDLIETNFPQNPGY